MIIIACLRTTALDEEKKGLELINLILLTLGVWLWPSSIFLRLRMTVEKSSLIRLVGGGGSVQHQALPLAMVTMSLG